MSNINDYAITEYNRAFIERRADPYIYKHTDGTYYFTASVPEYDRIVLRKADTIDGLGHAEERTLWTKHDTGVMSKHVWAPELHYMDGKWYIYYAAGEADDIWKIRPCVLECADGDPYTGAWLERGLMKACDDDDFSFSAFSLDGTVFENKGEHYFVWAEKVGTGKQISNLYIARMESPFKLSTVQVMLTTPDYDWERVGFWVNEGPAILKHGGRIFLTFSASSTGSRYCVGMMDANEDDDLLDPRSWKKSRYPVLRTDEAKGIYGPGHNSFTKSEDGSEDIMVYHARQYDEIIGNPLYDPNRHAMLLTVKWGEDGTPVFKL